MSKSTELATLRAIERLQCGINALIKKPSGGGGVGGDASASNQLTEIKKLELINTTLTEIKDNTLSQQLSSIEKISEDLEKFLGEEYISGSFLNTDDTNTQVQQKVITETGLSEFKEITLIFHGTGGNYGGINAYDGRVYIFKIENGFIINNDEVTVPTTLSPITGLLGLEITYIGK
jgi:hypothetical protein